MTEQFAKSAMVRAIRTICQTAVAMIGTSVVLSDVDWYMVISASLLSGLLSLLTSIATGLPEVDLQETLYSLDNVIDEEEDEEVDDIEGDDDDGTAEC